MVQGAVAPIIPDVPEGAVHSIKPVHHVNTCHEGSLAGRTGKLRIQSPTEFRVDERFVHVVFVHRASHVIGDGHPSLWRGGVTTGMGNVAMECNYVSVGRASVGEKAVHPSIGIETLGGGAYDDGARVN